MVKINWSGLAVLTALTLGSTLGSALGLGTAPVAAAQDARAPMVRVSDQRPDNAQRGAVMVRGAQARGGAAQRQGASAQRTSAVVRRDDKKPAPMRRDATAPTRERVEVERAGNATRRSR